METNAIIAAPAPATIVSATWLVIFPWLLFIGSVVLVIFLLPKIQDVTARIKPVFLGGLIAVSLAGFTFSETFFSGDDAYKYVNPFALYFLKYGLGIMATMLLALKLYISTDYAKHLQGQDVPPQKSFTTTDTHTEQVVPAPKAAAPPMTGLAGVRPASEAPISSLNTPQGTK